jgi:hypothetical protein
VVALITDRFRVARAPLADISVTYDAGVLQISGARKEDHEEKGHTFHVRERRLGRVSRGTFVHFRCPLNGGVRLIGGQSGCEQLLCIQSAGDAHSLSED